MKSFNFFHENLIFQKMTNDSNFLPLPDERWSAITMALQNAAVNFLRCDLPS